MTTRALAAAGLLALAAATACATGHGSAFERSAAAGRTDEMIRIFEGDSSLWKDPDAVLAVALAYALPGSGHYDPVTARDYLHRLVRFNPRSAPAIEARHLDILLAELQRVGQAADTTSAALQRLAARTDSLEAHIDEQRQSAQQLQSEIRRRDAQIKSLQDELERLKSIDLRMGKRRTP